MNLNYNMIRQNSKTILEYIWIGGKNEIRSKTRVINNFLPKFAEYIPEWNYDGSSTWQADSNGDTEIILRPCNVFSDTFRNIEDANCYLVLCDTYNSKGEPTKTNYRNQAAILFDNFVEEEPWFGLEQEYYLFFKDNKTNQNSNTGLHYCGNPENKLERIIAEQHLQMCIEIGIKISGINAEVSNGQWEFQIGPCEGIEAGDHLIVARYLLERIAERYDAKVSYHPKPIFDISGSGCHINFSTFSTRSENGIENIYRYIQKLEGKHKELIKVYGDENNQRLTGLHETSSIKTFSWGVGTRNTSIRIPNQTQNNKCGYFEDRRPAANIDPYLATSSLCNFSCLEEINI
jgi:glutamine synthetase